MSKCIFSTQSIAKGVEVDLGCGNVYVAVDGTRLWKTK
ncbi:UDP-N-acetylglucosamine pyrophosphorylase [Alicyclobacillus hesperidum URH17-3-68]|nr:UDP-N-acetylglucosamine pyrophosphorylase [Alicyclobacillus hesperidum URH17-3-68]